MRSLRNLTNAIAVQLFKHVPWLAERWAAGHSFVEGGGRIPWAPLRRPLREATVALVTTAGVHLKGDTPFDMTDPEGDPSFRSFPADTPSEALMITHNYYDHSAADRDLNVVLPLDRMRELTASGRIAGLAPTVYSFMGHIDGHHVETLLQQTAPEVARRLTAEEVDAVILTPA